VEDRVLPCLCRARIRICDGGDSLSAGGARQVEIGWIWAGDLASEGYTETDLRILARVLSRPCPYCKSPPGAYCENTRTGQRIEGLDN